MKKSPCPILIVTANPVDNSSMIFEAMGYGALDVVMTPTIRVSYDSTDVKDLRNKIDVIAKLTGKAVTSSVKDQKSMSQPKPLSEQKLPLLVVLGSSTGGPFALATILASFPVGCPYAFVVIQHVDEAFSSGFASWLASQIKLPVKIAENGDMIKEGCVLVAGKNDHLVLTGGLFLKYTPVPEEVPYRPSVDVFFQSVARYWPTSGVAVLLTGMGSDGALGMKVLSNVGWHTIAEHQSSCVVYGMPKAAIDMGAAKQVLVLEKIASEIVENLKKDRMT